MFAVGSMAPAVMAQQVTVTAQVDRQSIPLNQSVNFSLTIVGGSNVAPPTLPSIDGFRVEGTSQSSQFSFSGGQSVSQLTFTYILQPTKEGQFTIPPVTIVVDGTPHTTAPVPVEVTPPASGNPGSTGNTTDGRELFIEAEVDNPNPYLGQQITYIFRFYQAVNLFGSPEYSGPSFSGFWNKQETSQSQSNTQIDNTVYRVTELRTILFPTIPGNQTIEPSQLSIPGRMFQAGVELQTDPVVVDVQPFPQPEPEDFSGAVGQLSLSLDAHTESGDTEQPLAVELNEAVTLRATIEGIGNFDTLQDISLPQLDTWRAFDSTSSTDSRVNNGQLLGRRTIEQLIVPTSPGDFEIPSLQYVYFNPDSANYQTLTTEPIKISVQGAVDPNANAQPAPLAELERRTGSVERLDADIRHIKPVPVTLDTNSRRPIQRPLFWILWALPLLLIAGDGALAYRKRILSADPVTARSLRAHREAQRQIQRARANGSDPYGTSKEIMTNYLSNKLNCSVSGLTQRELNETLRHKNLPIELVQETESLLALSDMGQYAPLNDGQKDSADLFATTEDLLRRLEKSFGDASSKGSSV